MLERLVRAEINLKDYAYNLSQIKRLVGEKVRLMAVVKANAYGHGSVEIAGRAVAEGADYLGVVCLFEGRKLREHGIKAPILLLNYLDPEAVPSACDLNLTINVMDKEVLKAVDTYGRKKGKKIKIHVKIDTGMHRAGVMPQEALKFITALENCKNVELEGIFTHLSTADEKDLGFTHEQLDIFDSLLKVLKNRKINPPLIHAANSAATLRLQRARYTMVRPGIITYGLAPSADFRLPFKPKPILTLKTKIVQIRTIDKGESVGYGRGFIAGKKTKVALIPVGYGDGYRRGPKNVGFVLVGGQKAPILGRVSMDQTSVDVTSLTSVKPGDEVILVSPLEKSGVSAREIAQRIGTINYEVTTALAARVSRIYR